MGDGDNDDTNKPNEALAPLIYFIRSRRVILDADLARLHGVSTRRFNEAFRRNQKRFPEDFAFRLTKAEFGALKEWQRSKGTQLIDPKADSRNWSQFATSSSRHRGGVYRPWAFTEQV